MLSTIKNMAGQVAGSITERFGQIAGYFTPETLIGPLRVGFETAGITTVELLKNDGMVRFAAKVALGLMPGSMAIELLIGEERFVGFVFKIRDALLSAESLDLAAWLSTETITKALREAGLIS